MVVGAREGVRADAERAGHALGNRLFNRLNRALFGLEFTDILSGYRAFSRRFVKSFPAVSSGFEIETEMTIHALELRMPVAEIPAPYRARPRGSASKLSTWSDGFRIVATIVFLYKEVRPVRFFGTVFGALALISLALAYPVIAIYLATGLVPRLPTAVLSTGIMLLAFSSLICGIVLDSVSRGRREAKRLRYLQLPAANKE